MKQSPAPVVSTTFRHHTGWIRTSNAQTTGCGSLCIRDRCRLHVCGDEITVSTEKIGCFIGPSVLTCNEPLVPRLTRTVSAPCSSITRAAASASSSDSVFLPASHLASSESSPQGLLQQARTGTLCKATSMHANTFCSEVRTSQPGELSLIRGQDADILKQIWRDRPLNSTTVQQHWHPSCCSNAGHMHIDLLWDLPLEQHSPGAAQKLQANQTQQLIPDPTGRKGFKAHQSPKHFWNARKLIT